MDDSVRQLFGGAICAAVPKQFIDVSDFRPIPDHQEMFSEVETDRSVIIELMSTPENFSVDTMAASHWAELANVNEASSVTLDTPNTRLSPADLPGFAGMEGVEWQASWCCGKQLVSKYKNEGNAPNTVMLYLACLRLPKFETDLLVTLNDPIHIHQDSSSAAVIDPQAFQAKGDGKELFRSIVASVRVLDFSLFG
mmetsp:Transcript_14116/g.21966  ORF Transcript_14116/g.21966 Transcript_14116/m.21966 type:complete len:196 (-) Transcript_14116:551-1138(-)|eukprot:CAMPEP_0201510078 /NCGR_PEP_ID=MMETSP0161_2-20130828/2918_1 /ASSEMBLY_ACC=CAM_ASM_000251 /TAXON_ID=180227 /ORGANISM="Neoparamoeba aestuarina, Strain SoJaBio B1-5/56/2" /LENGTH=195 /DNA_ID=CAMNT_0047905197 /DNA_START=62 /DNA_END=649 /DNA_ORIENTATION=+